MHSPLTLLAAYLGSAVVNALPSRQELAREGTSHHLLLFIAITKIITYLGFLLRDHQ